MAQRPAAAVASNDRFIDVDCLKRLHRTFDPAGSRM